MDQFYIINAKHNGPNKPRATIVKKGEGTYNDNHFVTIVMCENHHGDFDPHNSNYGHDKGVMPLHRRYGVYGPYDTTEDAIKAYRNAKEASDKYINDIKYLEIQLKAKRAEQKQAWEDCF